MITGYSFGRMEIGGEVYRNDLIILPGGAILHPWWRNFGHKLTGDDLRPILAAPPKVLIVGTGDPGLLTPEPGLIRELEMKGIEVVVLPTARAVDRFNRLAAEGRPCAGCFHLTC
jgi:hypothetical protein